MAALGVIVGILGLAVATIALFPAFNPRSADERPRVEIQSIALDQLKEADFDLEVAETGEIERAISEESAITIGFANTGGADGLIESAILTVSSAQQLTSCEPGAGGNRITLLTDAIIPNDVVVPSEVPVELNGGFVVPADSFDRLAISVGPRTISEGENPWIYLVKVTFTDNHGDRLETADIALLSGGNDIRRMISDVRTALPPSIYQDGCLAQNRQALESARQGADLIAPALEQLMEETITTSELPLAGSLNLDTNVPENLVGWDNDPVLECQQIDIATETLGVSYGDFTSDGVPDALALQSCVVGTGGAPSFLTVYDGATMRTRYQLLGLSSDGTQGVELDYVAVVSGQIRVAYERVGGGTRSSDPVITAVFQWNEGQFELVEETPRYFQ